MTDQFEILTIGAYGFDQESFYSTLVDEAVECFCDIRERRGMRGPKYAFANSRALQQGLKQAGIPYVHERSLAPSPTLRSVQRLSDAQRGETKQGRTTLSALFVERYTEEKLQSLDAESLLVRLCEVANREIQNVVFFCVESRPQACHRSLLAEELAAQLQCPVRHLSP